MISCNDDYCAGCIHYYKGSDESPCWKCLGGIDSTRRPNKEVLDENTG